MTKISTDFTISITNLKIETIIGVLEEEKQNPQTIIIDAKITFDGSKSAKSDKIEDTIDYFQVTRLITENVQASSFELLEKLLDFIINIIMKFSLVKEAEVTIHKPKALESFGASLSISAKASNTKTSIIKI